MLSLFDFGAVGDGSVDDTSAIQNAINAAIAQNKDLFIPAGHFKFSAPLTATTIGPLGQGRPLKIKGVGHVASWLSPTSALVGKTCLTLDGSTVAIMPFVLEDFGIEGVPGAVAGDKTTLVKAIKGNASRYTRVSFGERNRSDATRYADRGLRMMSASAAFILEDCHFNHHHDYGVTAAEHIPLEIACTFSGNATNGSPTLTGISYAGSSNNVAGMVTDGVLAIGMGVTSGGGIPAGATVASYNVGANTITLSANATATAPLSMNTRWSFAQADWSGNKAQVIRCYAYNCGYALQGGIGIFLQCIGGWFQGNDTSGNYAGFKFYTSDAVTIMGNYMEEMEFHNPYQPMNLCQGWIVEGNTFGKCGMNFSNLWGARFVDNLLYRSWASFDSTCRDIEWGPNSAGGLSVAFSGNISNGSPVMTGITHIGSGNNVAGMVTDGFVVGMTVRGPGIPAGAKVASYNTGANTITLTNNATATAAVALTADDVIGLVGELPWWTPTLVNGWTASPGLHTPGYRKHQDGSIEFTGGVTGGTPGLHAFVVHEDSYAPVYTSVLTAWDVTGAGAVGVACYANRQVTPLAGTNVSLAGMRFSPK
jgi:hypothetical protein